MIFTHKLEVHYPATKTPGLDAGGAHLLMIEIIDEMAAQNLTQSSATINNQSDGADGVIFSRLFVSEAAAQEFVTHVDRLYPTVAHTCTVSQI